MAFACQPCNKTSKMEQALKQHLQDAPRHREDQYCETCDRHFNRASGSTSRPPKRMRMSTPTLTL